MFDRYYCIKSCLIAIIVLLLHVHCLCFENATSRANTNVMLTSYFYVSTVYATDADVTFYDGPGMHTVKAAKQVFNSTRIALLKHGFVLVKTWLLIACGRGFYAIILASRYDTYCDTLFRLELISDCMRIIQWFLIMVFTKLQFD